MISRLDTLVIGGPTLPFVTSTGIRQVHFSFDGLGEAYQLIPECETLIVVPDRRILAELPSAEAFKHYIEGGSLHPIFGELGVINLTLNQTSDAPVLNQVARNLDSIPTAQRAAFIQRGAAAFFGYVLGRTFNVVNGGGTVFVLAEEDLPAWSNEERAFLSGVMPGILFSQASTWSARVSGAYAWMLSETRSSLEIGLALNREDIVGGADITGIPDPLPTPERILAFLPPEISVHVADGALDRAERYRVLVLKWGTGAFVIAPAMSWNSLLARLKLSAPSESPSEIGRPAEGTLVAMLPRQIAQVKAWDDALGWGDNDNRSGAIKSVRSLAATLDAVPPGNLSSSKAVAVYDDHGPTQQMISGDALRKRLERVQKRTALPEDLHAFLAASHAAWKARFRHS